MTWLSSIDVGDIVPVRMEERHTSRTPSLSSTFPSYRRMLWDSSGAEQKWGKYPGHRRKDSHELGCSRHAPEQL